MENKIVFTFFGRLLWVSWFCRDFRENKKKTAYLFFVTALHLFWHLSVKFLLRNVIEMEDSHSAFILYLVLWRSNIDILYFISSYFLSNIVKQKLLKRQRVFATLKQLDKLVASFPGLTGDVCYNRKAINDIYSWSESVPNIWKIWRSSVFWDVIHSLKFQIKKASIIYFSLI